MRQVAAGEALRCLRRGRVEGMRGSSRARGQSVAEYALLLGIVAAAVIGIQTYIQRGLQSKVQFMADLMGSQREGAEDLDLRFEWKVKGDSQIESRSGSRGRVDLLAQGAQAYDTHSSTQSEGVQSLAVFADPNQ